MTVLDLRNTGITGENLNPITLRVDGTLYLGENELKDLSFLSNYSINDGNSVSINNQVIELDVPEEINDYRFSIEVIVPDGLNLTVEVEFQDHNGYYDEETTEVVFTNES